MTLTIDLDDRAWFDAIPVDGIGVHVVEGVREHQYHGHISMGQFTLCHICGLPPATCQRTTERVIPPEWVALSEQNRRHARSIHRRYGHRHDETP